MNATFTNVAGDDQVLAALVDCWASLYGATCRSPTGPPSGVTEEPALAVVVQEMVPSERSGVMFTADPSTGDTDHIVIEAAFGQGEVVVSGQVEPDTYVVDKDGPAAPPRPGGDPALQDRPGARRRGPAGPVDLEADEGSARVLTDDEALELAALGLAVEAHYGCPQDTEWAMAGGRTYLVQSRPITTLGTAAEPAGTRPEAAAPCLVQGLAASAGRASGRGAGAGRPPTKASSWWPARSWWPP